MRILSTLYILTLFLISSPFMEMHAAPVRHTQAVYTQPDGSTFHARIKGDEWTKIRTTEDGYAIIQNEDGWWNYCIYDETGKMTDTGHHVGYNTPGEILNSSRIIPYSLLAAKASRMTTAAKEKNSEELRSVRRANSMQTKNNSKSTKRGLIIPIQFKDVSLTYTKEDFWNMLNLHGYNGTGSAKDYFEDQFGEGWEFNFDVCDPVTLSNNRKYYGANDSDGYDIRPATMAWEACKSADSKVDFSLYDDNGDGVVDNVYIFYAGYDEAENTGQTDLIWAHQYYINNGYETLIDYRPLDGMVVDRYACSSELTGRKQFTGIGTFCHEYAHTFGLPDFYDTNYDEDGTWAAGLWKHTSLMDGGNYNNDAATPPNFNCIERMLLGLSLPTELNADISYTLEPVHKNGQYYILNTDISGEYFLFECRSNEGWDQYIGGAGMLAYHIDENPTEFVQGQGMMSKWEYNTINTDVRHQCADLIEADNRSNKITYSSSFNNIRGIFFPQTRATSLTPDTHSEYKMWNGNSPRVSLTDISYSNESISFRTVSTTDVPEVPDVTDFEFSAYPDAIFISCKPKFSFTDGKATVKWKKYGESQFKTAEIKNALNGKYSYLITGLESNNTLYEIHICFEVNGVQGSTYVIQTMTKRSPDVIWPYLYMGTQKSISRSKGFITHVVNAQNAKETAWYLDGEPLRIYEGHCIYPQKNGRLSCIIMWEDGSTDTIIKEITVTE